MQFLLLAVADPQREFDRGRMIGFAERGDGRARIVLGVQMLRDGDVTAARSILRWRDDEPELRERFRLLRYAAAVLSESGREMRRIVEEIGDGPAPTDILERRARHRVSDQEQEQRDRPTVDALLDDLLLETPRGPKAVPALRKPDPPGRMFWKGGRTRGTALQASSVQYTFVDEMVASVGRRLVELGATWRLFALASTTAYLAAGALLAAQVPLAISGGVLLIAVTVDIFDGWLAEQLLHYTKALYLDFVLDRLGETAVAIGLFLYVGDAYGYGLIVVMCFLAATFYVAYSTAQAVALGLEVDPDIFDRGVRWSVLLLGLAFARPLYAVTLATSLAIHTSLDRTINPLFRARTLSPTTT